MVDRPLEDVRKFGPFFSADFLETDEQREVDEDVQQFKQQIEESKHINITNQEALALYQINTPMLQSYIVNTLQTVNREEATATVKSVMEAKATKDYSRKVGSYDELQEALGVFE